MVGHYLATAVRSLRHQSMVTGLAMFSLALGLVGFIIAYSVVRYLETAEYHFSKADRIYLVSTDITFTGEQRPLRTLLTVPHAAKYLVQEFPDLEAVVRVADWGETAVAAAGNKINVKGVSADPQFLTAFDLEFVFGNSATALAEPRSVLITEAVAVSLYGSREAVGKPIRIDGLIDATVTGVIRPLPSSSNFDFGMLASWDINEAITAIRRPARAGPQPELWLAMEISTYVLLPQAGFESGRGKFLSGITGFARKYIPANQLTFYEATFSAIALSSLKTAHLDQALFSNVAAGISITQVLFLLGAIILGLAAINYSSLEIAQAAGRFKEAAARRVAGATTYDLVLQQWYRTTLHSIVALITALVLVLAAAPIIDRALDVEIRKVILSDGPLWTSLLLAQLLVGIAAGGYIALASTRVAPGRAMKSPVLAASGAGRAVMVGGQFAAASLLLVVLIVVDQQAQVLRSSALATQQESVVLVGNSLRDARIDFAAYKNIFSSLPGVEAISALADPLWTQPRLNMLSQGPSDEAARLAVTFQDIEQDFFRTFGISLLAGRRLDAGLASDLPPAGQPASEAAGPRSIVVDRALSERLGYRDPAGAIGQLLYHPYVSPAGRVWEPHRIVGVAENRPLTVVSDGAVGNVFALTRRTIIPVLKVSAQNLPTTIVGMDRAWNELAPDIPLDIRFVDAVFDQGHRPFRMLFYFVSGLMLLAASIALAGLVAIAVHESHHRLHEIAVRKTLGAPARTVALDLLGKFSVPVLAGNLVALPLAYLASQAYLSMFTLRIDLSVRPFLFSFLATLLIAWAAVGFQVVRAARLNPATVLRYE